MVRAFLLGLLGLASLACSTLEGKGRKTPEPHLQILTSQLRTDALFAHAIGENPSTVGDQDRAFYFWGFLQLNREWAMSLVGNALRDLSTMKNPYVSEPVANEILNALENEYYRPSSPYISTDELDKFFEGPDNEPIRLMCNVKFIQSVPGIGHRLLRLFYRIIARVREAEGREKILIRHLQSAMAETVSQENELLGIIFSCMIVETIQSFDLLLAFCRALLAVDFAAFKDHVGDLAGLGSSGPATYTYCRMMVLYLRLELPLAVKTTTLQSDIDWMQAFKVHGFWPYVALHSELSKHPGYDVSGGADDSVLRKISEKTEERFLFRTAMSLLFKQMGSCQGDALIDIRPGVKRYVNYLWRKGERLYAQALAIATCNLYDLESWEGEAGWKASRELAAEIGDPAVSVQATIFHMLPREILSRIGPIMPVLVSKATYQLVELRASASSLPCFVSRVLRPFDVGTIEKLLALKNDKAVGLSLRETVRVRGLIASAGVTWIGRLLRVADAKRDRSATAELQGRNETDELDHVTSPPLRIAHITCSLIFGIVPFESTSLRERLDLLSIVKSQYPWFVSLVQALEALTRGEGDKLARAQELASMLRGDESFVCLACDWLFARYLSETELFELVKTRDMESRFWSVLLGVCAHSCEYTGPRSALKRCAGVIKKALLERNVEKFKVSRMCTAFGIPMGTVDGMLRGDDASISSVFPSLKRQDRVDKVCQTVGGLVSGASEFLFGSPRSCPSRPSWVNSVEVSEYSGGWRVLLNFSDDDIIGRLRDQGESVNNWVLLYSLSVSAKDRIVAEMARDRSSFNRKIASDLLNVVWKYVSDGWEPESVIFDGRLCSDERYRRSIGLGDEGICARLVQRSRDDLMGTYRLHHFLFANLYPATKEPVRAEISRHPDAEVVLPMLLEGRTVRSIGKNLYLLAEGKIGEVKRILSNSLIKQEYSDRIMAAVTDYPKRPRMALDMWDFESRRQFIKSFDLVPVEGRLRLACKAFKALLKHLAVLESDGDKMRLELCIRYLDGDIRGRTTASMQHLPVYLFREIFAVVNEPFELEIDVKHLHAASSIGDLNLPNTVTVRVLNQPEEIAKQLKLMFELIK